MDPSELLPTTTQWWQLILALLVIVAGWILSRFARKGVLALARRAPGISESIALFAARFIAYAIVLLAIGIGLALLGANIQPLLAIVIILVVVLVLVLRGVADNFAAGVLIQARQPLKLGDEIQVEGPDGAIVGTATELNARTVVLATVDGRTIHVPNAKLLEDCIVNHSTQGLRRSEINIRIQRHDDIQLRPLLTQLTNTTKTVSEVDVEHDVLVLLDSVSPARYSLRLQFWHDPLRAATATSAVVEAISDAFDHHGTIGTVTSVAAAPPLTTPEPV